MNKTKIKIYFILILIVSSFFYFTNRNVNLKWRLNKHGVLSIGKTIDAYSGTGGTILTYQYATYKGFYYSHTSPTKFDRYKPEMNKKYVVLYDSIDPSYNLIFYDLPADTIKNVINLQISTKSMKNALWVGGMRGSTIPPK